MRNIFALAALLVPALLAAVPARAADPTLVAGAEKYLRDDEKAILAAILTHPDLSAEFDAETPLALKDPKNLGPYLGVWRSKLEAFAETDGKRGNPNLDARYSSYAQLMTAEQRAYMVRRLGTMKEDDKNSLIGYLNSVNDALTKNGELTWYTKKVVAGIMDQYRKDLTTYAATPIAQTAKRDASTSANAFAAIRKADEDARLAAAKPVTPVPTEVANAPVVKAPVKPTVKPVPTAKPSPTTKPAPEKDPTTTPESGSVVTTKPGGGALDQANDAARAGSGAGQIIDGGGAGNKPTGDVVVVPSGSGGARPTLSPGKPGSEAGLAGSIPPVPAAGDAGFMDSIKKMQTKPATTPMSHRLPMIAGGLLGGILGGLVGFFLGGPVGLIIGAGLGIAGGAVAGKLVANKLFQ